MSRRDIYAKTIPHYLDPVVPYIADPEVTDIMINGPSDIYFEKGGRLFQSDRAFASEHALLAAANNISEFVDRPLGKEHLALDGRLPDNNRVNILFPPVSEFVCITIRKHRDQVFTLDELLNLGSLQPKAHGILRKAVLEHENMVIAGATGSGKTGLLRACAEEIPADERVVVIEDSTEIMLSKPHVISLQSIPPGTKGHPPMTQREILANVFRMRPDRIILGEVRRGEALDMIQALLSGHAGSLSTIHAGSPETAATRLETLCLQSDTQLPVYVARAQVAAAVKLFVQVVRRESKRYVSRIARLKGLDRRHGYVWEDVYAPT